MCTTTPCTVKDDHVAFYNLYTVIRKLNEADVGQQFQLDKIGFPHRASNAAGLYAQPAPLPPSPPDRPVAVTPNVLVEVITADPTGNPLPASAAAAHYLEVGVDGSGTPNSFLNCMSPPGLPVPGWAGSPGSVATNYSILYLRHQGNFEHYMDLIGGNWVMKDAQLAPSVGVLGHELGHILGFTEQRSRRYPLSEFYGPTGNLGMWDVDDAVTGVVSAYADWLMSHTYGTGNASSQNSWRMHEVLSHRDAGDLHKHVRGSGSRSFKSYNPQRLRWDSVKQYYVDCETGKMPVYTMQFSEVEATPADDAFAQFIATEDTSPWTHKVTRQLNKTASGQDIVGVDSAWAQWEWETPIAIPMASSHQPGTTASIHLMALLTSDPVGSPIGDDDDFQSMTVKLYPEDTTDRACRAPTIIDVGGTGDDDFGASIARTVNGSLVVVGAPRRDLGGVQGVGGVVVYNVAHPSRSSGVTQQVTLLPGGTDVQANLGLGTSVAHGIVDGYDVVAAGAPLWDNGMGGVDLGAVFLFLHDNGAWYRTRVEAGIFLGSPGDKYGQSVAIANNLLMVGAPGMRINGTVQGEVRVYEMHVDTTSGTPTLVISNPVGLSGLTGLNLANAEFGYSLAHDGNNLVVGAPGYGNSGNETGMVSVFNYNPTSHSWVHQTNLFVGSPGPILSDMRDPEVELPIFTFNTVDYDERFGESVSISSNLIAVGAPEYDFDENGVDYHYKAGAVFLFKRGDGEELINNVGNWYRTGTLVPGSTDRHSLDYFGKSVMVAEKIGLGASRVVVVGAPNHDYDIYGENRLDQAGAVFVFDLTKHGDLRSTRKLDASSFVGTRQSYTYFGSSLDALSMETFNDVRREQWHEIFVGAPGADAVGKFLSETVPEEFTIDAVSAEQPGHLAAQAIDGIENDDQNYWLAIGMPANIDVDLGSNVNFSFVRLKAYANRPYSFTVEALRDSGAIDNVTTYVPPGPGPTPDAVLIPLPGPVVARKIRLTVTACASCPAGHVAIQEFSVF